MVRAPAVGAIAICAALLTTTALYAESLGEWYDTNGNGVIDKEEVLDAIADYFRDKLTREGVVELISFYFAGTSIETSTVVRESGLDLALSVSAPEVVGYWADGSATVKGEIKLTPENSALIVGSQPVEAVCIPNTSNCHWQTDVLADGSMTASTGYTIRVPMGTTTLRFTYGGDNALIESLEYDVYVPERIVGVTQESWDCYIDRELAPAHPDAQGGSDFYGCAGWISNYRDFPEIIKWDNAKPIVTYVTGDEEYIEVFRESLDEMIAVLYLDLEWTDQPELARFKVYTGIPGDDWASYGLTDISPGLVKIGGFARCIADPSSGEVISGEVVIFLRDRSRTALKFMTIHEVLHILGAFKHVAASRPDSVMGYSAHIPKLSPMDKAILRIQMNPLVKPGMTLEQVRELVVFEADLLDQLPEPDDLEVLWHSATQLVDSGAVRFHLSGGWTDCNYLFGTESRPAILEIGDFRRFLLEGPNTAYYAEFDGPELWMRFSELEGWHSSACKLPRALYTAISDWENLGGVTVSRTDETISIQAVMDESMPTWPGLTKSCG